MGKLIVTRPFQYANLYRTIRFYIDGELKARIASAETCEFELNPGSYRIHARIDYCRTRDLTIHIEPGSEIMYELSSPFMTVGEKPTRLFDWAMLIRTLMLIAGFVLAGYFESMMILWITLAGLSLWTFIDWRRGKPYASIIYYLTLGHRDYIQLKQINSSSLANPVNNLVMDFQ